MSLGSMEERMEELKKRSQEIIQQAYQRGYNEGYSKAENDYYAQTEKDRQSSYELGLNMAWEAARKLVSMGYKECNEVLSDGVLAIETVDEIFVRCTASEAIEKIKTYEEKKQEEDEIKVGDEVYFLDGNYHSVVTSIYDSLGIKKAVCITQNGKWDVNDIDNLHKTGRHFPQIAEVLKKLKEEEE